MHIAILTRLPSYYSEVRLQEEAELRGHQITMVEYPKCYMVLGVETIEVLYADESLQAIDAIIPRITVGGVAYGAAITRQLEVVDVFTTASSLAIARAFDHLRSIQVLRRYGVRTPTMVFARETEVAEEVLSHFELPVVVRSASGEQSVIAESPKAAYTLMRAFSDRTGFMVQECLKGKSVDIAAMVIGNRVVASVCLESMPSVPAKAVKLTDEETKLVLRAARAIGLRICSVQFIRNDNGSYVLSVAATPDLKVFEEATGRNVARKVVEYIEMNAKRRNKKDRVGA